MEFGSRDRLRDPFLNLWWWWVATIRGTASYGGRPAFGTGMPDLLFRIVAFFRQRLQLLLLVSLFDRRSEMAAHDTGFSLLLFGIQS